MSIKAIFCEVINERLIQVDQREISNNVGGYFIIASYQPLGFDQHDVIQERKYVMVSAPFHNIPAIFILEQNI